MIKRAIILLMLVSSACYGQYEIQNGDSGETVRLGLTGNFDTIWNDTSNFVNYQKLLGEGYCIGIPADSTYIIVKHGQNAPQEVIDLMPDSTLLGGTILLGSSKGFSGGYYNHITLTGGIPNWLEIIGMGRNTVISGGTTNNAITVTNTDGNPIETARLVIRNLTVDVDNEAYDGIEINDGIEITIDFIQKARCDGRFISFESPLGSSNYMNVVRNCIVTGCGREFVYVAPGLKRIMIINNNVVAAAQVDTCSQQIKIEGNNCLIANNIIFGQDHSDTAIFLTSNSRDNKITGNKLFDPDTIVDVGTNNDVTNNAAEDRNYQTVMSRGAGNQTIGAGSMTQVEFNLTVYDVYDQWDANKDFVPEKSGYYTFHAVVRWGASVDQSQHIIQLVDEADVVLLRRYNNASGTGTFSQDLFYVGFFEVGKQYSVEVEQNSGSDQVLVQGAEYTRVETVPVFRYGRIEEN